MTASWPASPKSNTCNIFTCLGAFSLIQHRPQSGVSEFSILIYHISKHGTKPLPNKINVIYRFLAPQTKKQLRWFLELVAYYHCFIPHCVSLLCPLYALVLSEGKGILAVVAWTSEVTQAFEEAKKALANTTLLSHSHSGTTLSLTAEVSNTSIRADLHHHFSNCSESLAFFSRNLQTWEMWYSMLNHELLTTYLAVQHFHYFLEGQNSSLYTEHKLSVAAARNPSSCHSPREQWHMEFMLQLTEDIHHIKGDHQDVADVV